MRHFDGNPNAVILGGFGNGGTEELKEALENDSVMYGLGKELIILCIVKLQKIIHVLFS